jgi:hypothetical protein
LITDADASTPQSPGATAALGDRTDLKRDIGVEVFDLYSKEICWYLL